MLDPERAQIEKLEPTLFDIVLRPEEFISESSLEDESDYLEEIPAALIPLLSPQEPEEEQQPLDPNDYDQFRYYIITRVSTGRDVPGQTGTGRPVVPLSRDKKKFLSRCPFVPG